MEMVVVESIAPGVIVTVTPVTSRTIPPDVALIIAEAFASDVRGNLSEAAVVAIVVGTADGRGVDVAPEPQATRMKAKDTSTPMTTGSPNLRVTMADPLPRFFCGSILCRSDYTRSCLAV